MSLWISSGRRLETACLLLRSTALPVREIAFRLCFPDEHYFSSLFHRKLGLTPSAYRPAQGAVREISQKNAISTLPGVHSSL